MRRLTLFFLFALAGCGGPTDEAPAIGCDDSTNGYGILLRNREGAGMVVATCADGAWSLAHCNDNGSDCMAVK